MRYSLTRKISNNIKYFVKHKLLPKGLLARSMMILVLPILLSNLILGVVFYDNHWHRIGKKLAQGVSSDIAAVIALLDNFPKFEDQKKIIRLSSDKMDLVISIINNEKINESMEQTQSNWMTGELKSSLAMTLSKKNDFYIDEVSSEPDIVVYLQYYSNILRIEIPQRRFFSSSAYIFSLWMLATSILLLGIAAIFMKNQVRSIIKLSAAANEFGKGRDITFTISGASEIKQAGRSFLNMKNRIKRHMSERTYMLAGVSHDLRTPLTRMNLQLAMLDNVDSELLDGLKQDVKVMENMIDAYISFVKGDGAEPYTIVHLEELLRDVVDRFRVSGRNIDLTINNKISMHLRQNAMFRCLTNIIGNSIRYADKTQVALELVEDKFAVITVDDDGPGIEEDKFEEVFRAFYRIEDSRNIKTGGIGLGLTVSRDIVNAHGGEIALSSSLLGGLQVIIKLPI